MGVCKDVLCVLSRLNACAREDVAELRVVGLYHKDAPRGVHRGFTALHGERLVVPLAGRASARYEGVLGVGLAFHRAAERLETELEKHHLFHRVAGNLDALDGSSEEGFEKLGTEGRDGGGRT